MKKFSLLSKHLLFSVFFLLLLPIVFADGIYWHTYEFHAIEEKQQYAMIDVLSNNLEKINLFLSLSSTDYQPRNITLIIPLKSLPTKVNATKISSEEFLKKYGFNNIENQIKKQSLTTFVTKSSKITSNYLKDYLLSSLLVPKPLSLIRSFSNFYYAPKASAARGVKYIKKFKFEGGYMEVYKIKSKSTLEEFIKQYKGLKMPENLKKTIEKYKAYYIAILHLEVSPSKEIYNAARILKTKAPNTFKELINYIKTHPNLIFVCDPLECEELHHIEYCNKYKWRQAKCELTLLKIIDMMFENNLRGFIEKAHKEAGSNISGRDIVREVYEGKDIITPAVINFIFSAFSTSPKGIEVNIELPIEGEVYYPLGTGTAWQTPIKDIKVLVKMDKNLKADFEKKQHSTIYNGSRYYFWNFKDSNPDYDIIGKISKAGLLTKVSDSWKKIVIKMNENVNILSITFFILILVITVFVVNTIEFRYFGEEKSRKNIIKTSLLIILMPLFSIWITLFLPIIFKTECKKEEIKVYGRKLFIIFVTLFAFYIIFFLFTLI